MTFFHSRALRVLIWTQVCPGAGGRLVVLLEGGYSMQGLSEGVSETFQALLNRPPLHPHDTEVSAEPLQAAQNALDEVVALHGLAA